MAKKTDDTTTENQEPKLERINRGKEPEFKPGNKPYLEYDGQILNANVEWKNIIRDLLDDGYSIAQIAADSGCPIRTVNQVLIGNYDDLSFRCGANLVTLHSNKHGFCG